MNASAARTLVVVLLVNGLLAGAWWYVYSQIGRRAEEAVRLAGAISDASAKQDNIRTLAVFLSDIEADQKKISGVFTTSETLVQFIENMERLAGRSAVELTIQSATLPQTADGLPSFRIHAAGSFAGLYRLLALLETSPYHIALDDARLVKNAEKKNWSATLQFQLASFIR
ncbi:MAG: hypothetical protein HYT22_03475 [Candidatus Niyogibacteria bacterium]|nr:hypothetical protein [Candidatus Niyogibacteria bacterium]